MPNIQLETPDGLILTSFDFDEVPPGGTFVGEYGAPLEVVLRNISGVLRAERQVVALERPGFLVHQWLYFSLDGVTYSQGGLVLGDFAPDETKTLYCDMRVPADAPGGDNQRCDVVTRRAVV